MHSNFKPLSSVSTDVTAANFPALKHFWPCTESVAEAAAGLTDTVGGVVTGSVTATAADGQKITDLDQPTANNAIASGTLQPSGTKVAVLFAVGDLNAGVLNIGVPSGQGGDGSLQLLAVTSVHQADNGSASAATATATFGAATEAHAAVLVPGTSLTGYRIQANTTYGTNGTADTTDVPANFTTINQSTAFGNAGAAADLGSLYGCAVFHFASLPPDLEIAMQWMYNEWVNNNNKAIYPGWKDLV